VDESSVSDELTVQRLVEQAGLGLEVVAGHAGLDRVIEAVYTGDLDDPTSWMVQGSLLLTTGPKFEVAPELGARLVRLMRRSGMVGIGVAITPYVRKIPEAMVAAAEREGLPLLRVPAATPFREIASYVFTAHASRDMHRLRRSVALQKDLVEVLLEDQRVGSLVSRLGELLGVTVVLLDKKGQPVAASRPAAELKNTRFAQHAWEEYGRIETEGLPRSVMEVEARGVVFREIRLRGVVEQVLMAILPEEGLMSEFADAALTFAQRLLEVDIATDQSVSLVRRRTRAGLLDMLLHGRGSEAELREWLLHHGIESAEPWRVLAFKTWPAPGRSSPDAHVSDSIDEELLSAVDHVFEERLVPFVSCRAEGHVLALSPLGPPPDDTTGARHLAAEVAETLVNRVRARRVAVGVSEAMTGLAAVPRAAGQARLALRQAYERSEDLVAVAVFEDLGMRYALLDGLADDTLERLERSVVGRLAAADASAGSDLSETLASYLDHGCSVAETAEALYVHRNTLRKRLARIEALLGLDLSTTGGRVEAYLGVRAAEVLATRQA
jgi:PucR family transcriptional regulator, purine catabolism regulatory protein